MTSDAIEQFLVAATEGMKPSEEHIAVMRELVTRALALAQYDHHVDDLRVAARALGELLDGSRLMDQWRGQRKATVFGSARTPVTSPLYALAQDLSAALSHAGWLTITGGGPGIMAASAKGAGRQSAIGVNIELPFEHGTNEFIDLESRHLATSFFFTRKVIMTRYSDAFVAFPGGVGTMDELFEILTLLHTGKSSPVPIVLVDEASGTFWRDWREFLRQDIIGQGYLSDGDDDLFCVVTSVHDAMREILSFYSNFVSCDVSDGVATLQLVRGPSDEQLATLRQNFGAVDFDDTVDQHRLHFTFNGRSYATLRRIIDAVNQWR